MGRILLKILKWLAITVALLIVLVVGLGTWLLGTQSGREWAAGTGLEQARKAGLDITLDGLESPELGRWSARYFAFRQEGALIAEVRDFALAFQPRALFDKVVQVDYLRAAEITVNIPQGGEEEPPPEEPRQEPSLPDWQVKLDELAVGRLAVNLPEPPAGQPLPALAINGWLNAFGEQLLLADLQVEGLDQSDLKVAVQSKAVSTRELALMGSIRESAGGLLPSLLQLPEGEALAADFDLALVQRDQALDITIERLDVPLAGHQLGAAGAVSVAFEPLVVTTQPLVLITDGARHTVTARYSEAGADFDVTLNQLPLNMARPWVEQLEGGQLSGRVNGSWDPNAGPLPSAELQLNADARAYGKDVRAALTGRTSGNRVEIAPSKVQLEGAELTLAGPLFLEGGGTQLNIELRDFSTDILQGLPVTLPPDLSARTPLTTARVTGSLQDPHVRLQSRAEGSYQNQPLELVVSADATQRSATIGELRVQAASVQAEGAGTVDWTASGNDFRLRIGKLDQGVLAFAPPDVQTQLPPGLTFNARGDVSLAGAFKAPQLVTDLNVDGSYEVEGEPMPFAVALAGKSEGGDLASLRAEVQRLSVVLFDEPTLNLRGSYDRGTMDVTLELERLPMQALAALGNTAISGEATARLHATGTMEAPRVEGEFRYADQVQLQQGARRVSQPVALEGTLSSTQETFTTRLRFSENQREAGELTIELPLSRYLTALQNKTELPLAATAQGGFKLSALQLFLQDPTTTLIGDLNLDLELAGSPAAPSVDGSVKLVDARYANPVVGVDLRQIQLALAARGQRVTIETGTLRTPENGRLELAGAVNWSPEGRNRNDAIDLTATLRDAKLLDRRDVETSVNGQLRVAGSFERLNASGDVVIAPLEINLDQAIRESIPQIDVVEVDDEEQQTGAGGDASAMPVVALNIGIRTGRPAYLRGLGIETELEGEVRLRGTLDEPQYTGEFRTRRGELDALTKTFNISDGSIVFSNQVIGLNIPAVLEQDGYTFKIEVLGTATEPRFEFSSTPALPRDEILSRLLFGESVQNLSPFDAIALANAMRTIGQGGQGLTGKARNFLGVDDLELDTSMENPGIGVGKYLSDRVYFQIERNLNDQNPFRASIQYQWTPSLTLEGGTGETGAGQGRILWRKDY